MTERDAQGRFLPKNQPGTPVGTQIRVVVSAAEQFTESFIKKIVLDAVANLTRAPQEGGTPVATGWARANWLPRVGKPATEVVGDPESVTTSEQESGLGEVLRYTLASGPAYITNNVPYINRLNDGYSQQAPSGFVQRAIQEAVTGQRQPL